MENNSLTGEEVLGLAFMGLCLSSTLMFAVGFFDHGRFPKLRYPLELFHQPLRRPLYRVLRRHRPVRPHFQH